MRVARFSFALLTLFSLALYSCKASNQAGASTPAQLTTIPTTPGGIIEYGRVAGAGSLPAAMANVLGQIHQVCGEKPTVGQVFRVKGSNSAGVFFTVVDHAQNNRQLAGLVLAAQTGSTQFEAAVVSDSADQFGKTGNSMLQQLYAAWHPGDAPVASGASGANGSTSASATSASSPVPLHTVTAPDNSASIGVPDGWTMDPQSARGAIIVRGPNGEQLGMDMVRTAVDPTNPFQVNMARQRYSVIAPGTLVYPFHGDLNKDFVNVFQAWRHAAGQAPAPRKSTSLSPCRPRRGTIASTQSGK